MSKRKEFMARLVLEAIGEAHMQEDSVQLHVADYLLFTGTWRKLSI